jgi:hypothetical protein
MRFFFGHRLIGGFFVGASFRKRLHPEIPDSPTFTLLMLLLGFALLGVILFLTLR